MAVFQQTRFQQTRGPRAAAPKASRAAADILSRLARKTRYADPGLSENWPSIAGAEIASLGRPGRIIGVKAGRTLEVIVRDGAAAAAMQMRADDLLIAVNRYLGPGSIGRIAIRQQMTARAAAPAAGDGALDTALASFRAAVSKAKPKN